MMSKKKILLGMFVCGLAGAFIYFFRPDTQSNVAPLEVYIPATSTVSAFDPRNTTYEIEGESVALKNGEARSEAAPGSASQIVTRYFGNEATGDLTGDGKDDRAYLITQDGGGSGLFYYAVVALKSETGYTLTNTFFVGDRIAPQSTEIHAEAGELHINYAERKEGEPMSTPPSVGAVLLLKVTTAGVLEGLME